VASKENCSCPPQANCPAADPTCCFYHAVECNAAGQCVPLTCTQTGDPQTDTCDQGESVQNCPDCKCGNGVCDGENAYPAETCATCKKDCGTCTTPPTPVPNQFVDNGDGTITDTVTGLMWEKKDDAGGIHDKDNYYSWCLDANSDDICDNAGYPPDGSAFTSFLATLNTPPCFAGHCDWRLPTSAGCCGRPTGQAAELESIVNTGVAGCGSGSPCVASVFNSNCTPGCTVASCSCTAPFGYWSGLAVSANPDVAWAVWFLYGDVILSNKAGDGSVRAVRGGS